MVETWERECPSVTCNDEIRTFVKMDLRHSPLFDKDKPANSHRWTCTTCKTSFYTIPLTPTQSTLDNFITEESQSKRPKFDSHAFDKKAFVDD